MSLSVKINIKDDKGKEAEIEIKETDELSKLVIIQNVFNLFGIERDIFEQVKEFEKIGKAYSSFFEKMNQTEQETEEKIVHKDKEIKEQLIAGYEDTEEIKEVYEAVDDTPVWMRTGIKEDPDGRKRYRCRYHCVICYYKGTHYIYEGSSEIKCHSCRMAMPVKPAHHEGFPKQDTRGNFYRAGEYQDWNLS